MFRRYLSALLLVQGLVLAAPASSFAVDWYWIDSLSGPKFSGPVFEWRVVCFKDKAPANTRTEPTKPRVAGAFPIVVGGSIGPTCEYEPGQRRRGSMQVAYGFLGSKPEERFAGGESVKLTTLEPSLMWQVYKGVPLEAGLGVGLYWFSSKGLESFHRATLQPLRLDFRPFDWAEPDTKGSWLAAAFVVRFGIVAFPQGFTPGDFRDTENGIEPREVKKYFAISIDSEPILRRWVTGTWLTK